MGWGMSIPHLAFQHGSRIHLGLLAPGFFGLGSQGITPGWEISESSKIQRDVGPEFPMWVPGEHSGNPRLPLAQLDPGGKGAGTNIPIKPKFPVPARAKQKQLLSSAPQILWDNKTSGKLE